LWRRRITSATINNQPSDSAETPSRLIEHTNISFYALQAKKYTLHGYYVHVICQLAPSPTHSTSAKKMFSKPDAGVWDLLETGIELRAVEVTNRTRNLEMANRLVQTVKLRVSRSTD